MKLFVVSVLMAGLASVAMSSVQKIRLPKLPNHGTVPGIKYRGLIETSVPPTALVAQAFPPKNSHWVTMTFKTEDNREAQVSLAFPRIVDGKPRVVEMFEDRFFIALDAISRSRDPLAKTVLLARLAHFTSIDHQQLADLHNNSELRHLGPAVSHRERETYYQKLALYFEILRDTLLADKQFLDRFAVGEVGITQAQKSNDQVLASYIYRLDHQVVPRKARGARARWERYRLVRKIAKLPHEMRAKYIYLSEMIEISNKTTAGLDFAARRALLRHIHSSIGLAITERVPYINDGIDLKELLKYSDLDSRLWDKIYVLQKSTDVDLFSYLHHSDIKYYE